MTNRSSLLRGLGVSAAVLATASAVFSQSTTSLRGVIADPSGAVIPEAIVNLTNESNGARRSAISDATGGYQFLQVTPGTYTVVANKPGFATLTRTNVELLVNTPTSLDLNMVVSSAGASVNVAGDVSQVNTTDATVGIPFGEK